MPGTRKPRSALAISLGVWKALFLREVFVRIFRNRSAAVWMFVEPVTHIGFIMWLYVVGFRQKHVSGVDASVFVMLGVLTFFLPRNMINRSILVVDRTDALYMYRQVRPVDVVVARVMAESLIAVFIFVIATSGAAFLGLPIQLGDPLGILAGLGGLWLAGFGMALSFSVLANLSVEARRIVPMLLGPLYIFSGVLFPSANAPPVMRELLLLNPLLHGVELVRVAFVPTYRVAEGLSLVYLYQFGVVMVFCGLALQVRYRAWLISR